LKVIRRLTEGAVSSARRVLGNPILALYAPELRVRRFWCFARCFSFSLGEGQFCVLESEWDETPEYGIDYHTLHVAVENHPKHIPLLIDDRGKRMMGSPASVVEVGGPPSPVVAISLLESADDNVSDSVLFDSGLLFFFQDGRRLAIVAHRSIEGGVACALEPLAIEEILKVDRVRLEIT